MPTLVAGLDLGSTGIKLLVLDDRGEEVALSRTATPWEEDEAGAVVLTESALVAAVHEVLDDAARQLTTLGGGDAGAAGAPPRVEVLSVTGMGESGFLLGPDGRVLAPAFAWFDRTGADAVEALPADLRAQFPGRTGLPWGVQVSAAKIAHLRDRGAPVADARWLGLPEFVVHALGGPVVAERSLAARTGLLQVETGQVWPELLAHLGVGAQVVPPLVDAGTPVGRVDAARVPEAFAQAELSVAGHDHLVSSRASERDHAHGDDHDQGDDPAQGDDHEPAAAAADPDTTASPGGRYHVSLGTAEVLLRVIDTPLTFEARSRLGASLINCVPHVVPGRWVVVAGVKTGLLMRRTLTMLGMVDEPSHRALDEAVLALPADAPCSGITVAGARNDDGELALRIGTDEVSPALLMRAVLEHGNEEIARLVEVLDRELPPATSALLTGGWTSWASVREARGRVLPRLEVSHRSQDTAYGAAVSALSLLPAHR
ncbi:FGGY family carbohydrate kinase [uncultured Serinicoccus sp.]|uniref:FGGY family carbohydrate kinase n=1 Tax=uncultured Serinicoccus sp. TaxID=735514 RepID=UPI002636A46F|nr:FGGY family carbohydrate kinase [uncultured Serinicoccus sp.]